LQGDEAEECEFTLENPPSSKGSVWWKEYMTFHPHFHPDKKDYAACKLKLCFAEGKYCQGTISVKGGATSGMKRHLQSAHPGHYLCERWCNIWHEAPSAIHPP
jgi:hypothetical protein